MSKSRELLTLETFAPLFLDFGKEFNETHERFYRNSEGRISVVMGKGQGHL